MLLLRHSLAALLDDRTHDTTFTRTRGTRTHSGHQIPGACPELGYRRYQRPQRRVSPLTSPSRTLGSPRRET